MCSGLDPSRTFLFNSTLTSDILLILKSGDPDVIENCRPVLLLAIVSKSLERIVHSRMNSRFLFIVIPLVQFAYHTENSTEDWYLYAADHQLQTGIVIVDMSRSFGKVKQQLMIINLFTVGISSISLSWFVSYLSDCKQHVFVDNGDSSLYKPCESGVPQSRVLGPLLFHLRVYKGH